MGECRRGEVSVLDEGTIVLLEPTTDAEREWFEEHIDKEDSYQPYWPDRVVVERRYATPILDALIEAGFEVAKER